MPTSSNKKSSGGLGTAIVVLALIVFGLVYMQTGSDPLGLFEEETGSTPTAFQPATRTPKPDGGSSEIVPTLEPISPASGGWWEVYFVSPQRIRQAEEEAYGENGMPAEIYKGSITEKLVKRIDNAKKTVHIASFETDVLEVTQALIRAHERGVDVRWITDDEHGIEADEKPGHGQFALLQDAGIEVIDDQRGGLMHNKFWIFDGKTTWTGSTNITISGMFEQDNNVVVIESPELAAIYEREFEEMWGGEFGARSPSTVDEQQVNVGGSDIQVLFSPEDGAMGYIIPYVQGAKKSIYFMAFSFTQPDLGQTMLDRWDAGVKVSGVFETTGSETQYSEMPPFYCADIPVRQDGNFAFLHHKVIIVDERYVITGSLNLSDSANKSNNENVIIIDNKDIAKLFVKEFQRVWSVGTDPDPSKISCK